MKISYLTNKIPWFGKFSGYECLPNYLDNSKADLSIFIANDSFYNKLIGKIYQIFYKWSFVRTTEIAVEKKFLKKIKNYDAAHILYLEPHVHILSKFKNNKKNLIGTIHLPFDIWKRDNLLLLSKLDNVLILYKEELEKFSNFIPKNKIHFIRHGVDIDFFKPDRSKAVKKNKALFVGHYLRNFDMLSEVYQLIVKNVFSDIEFHFIIPEHYRDAPVLKKLAVEKHVFFHQNLSDEELLVHYQDSNVLLMPMENSGANTAIIQAISVGLPVLTTDVGGIRSYGGGDIFPVVINNDHSGMVQIFERYYNDTFFRDSISEKQRTFAVEELDWKIIANRHFQLYSKI